MAGNDTAVIEQMQALVKQWEEASDRRMIFLNCYLMMTQNMLTAIGQQEFRDPTWVDGLLQHFADYYFIALNAYDQDPIKAPRVWQLAFNLSCSRDGLAIQNLLLGVNAHINYDLVLTLVDLLEAEWTNLSDEQRAARYQDYCHVNDVIGGTIDAVQDQVLEPAMPVMEIIDRIFGSMDELFVSRLLTEWRESVWKNAVSLLENREPEERRRLIERVEGEALRMGEMISLRGLS